MSLNLNTNTNFQSCDSQPIARGRWAHAISEDDLDAFRFRGTPIPRASYPPHGAFGNAPELIAAADEDVRRYSAWVPRLRETLSRALVNQQDLIDRLLIALVANGHVLLEGVPGLTTTLAIKTLAAAARLRFRYLPFAPDMLPADLTGTMIYAPDSGAFHIRYGPIFSNFLLVNHIHRAPAKVQSALLDAMHGRSVTIGNDTYDLPEPFVVVATQNPVEHTDRSTDICTDSFLFKVIVLDSNRIEERTVVEAMAATDPMRQVRAAVQDDDIVAARRVVQSIAVDQKVKDYIRGIIAAISDPNRCGLNGCAPHSVSPRAASSLAMAAKASAFVNGRCAVTLQDVKALAPDVLRHRVVARNGADADHINPNAIISKVLNSLPTNS